MYGENGEAAVQMSLIDEHNSLFEKTSILVLGPSNIGFSASNIEVCKYLISIIRGIV